MTRREMLDLLVRLCAKSGIPGPLPKTFRLVRIGGYSIATAAFAPRVAGDADNKAAGQNRHEWQAVCECAADAWVRYHWQSATKPPRPIPLVHQVWPIFCAMADYSSPSEYDTAALTAMGGACAELVARAIVPA